MVAELCAQMAHPFIFRAFVHEIIKDKAPLFCGVYVLFKTLWKPSHKLNPSPIDAGQFSQFRII